MAVVLCFLFIPRTVVLLQFFILLSSTAFFFFFPCQHVSAIIVSTKHNNATDRSSLLLFKSAISGDPYRVLTQWNDTVHFCKWHGVTCGGPRHPERVVALELPFLDLVGTISPALANLTFLRLFNLSSNHFTGQIPSELADLSRLERLDLSANSLGGHIPSEFGSLPSLTTLLLAENTITGQIPPALANASHLRVLQLSSNNLSGVIPSTLGKLPNLVYLNLRKNTITGQIPPALSNASSLKVLHLTFNNLYGVIPPSLGKLPKLSTLNLGLNNLEAGAIPPALWNLSYLRKLGLDSSGLHGSLPRDIGQKLPNLQFLSVTDNHLDGEIPSSLANASQLSIIQLAINRFSGTIPATLGRLQYLSRLALFENQLEAKDPDDWSFVASLSNCTLLTWLELASNNLGGQLPNSIANLSTSLQFLDMGRNDLRGSIPQDIGNLAVSLTWLGLGVNALTGQIPVSLELLNNLDSLDFGSNNLSGVIPPNIGNLSQLFYFSLHSNSISGSIPTSLGKCKSLGVLNLGNNKLTGTVPKQVVSISTLSELYLNDNLLEGSIPLEIGSLVNMGKLYLQGNMFSGEIPVNLASCLLLEFLYLDRNLFNGSIPASISALRGLQELDLSRNNLSGKIPLFLENFHDLYALNLSYNNFEGELPTKGVFQNITSVSISGNDKLCGGNPMMHLQTCHFSTPNKKHKTPKIAFIISIASGFICLLLLFLLVIVRYWIPKKSRKEPTTNNPIGDQYANLSYAELVKATDGFSEANLIGSGYFGSVFRGKLDYHEHGGNRDMAVKVFNLQQPGVLKSFTVECDAFRNIRHRNLIKIITACSSIDSRGNDFKAIVFEFKANGSLESWLHPEQNEDGGPKNLSLLQRINIAIDVASALEYLHHYCQTPIIHCDLKPSNILLDDDMTALVSDFGIVRFMKESMGSINSTSSLGIKGTIGYIAPEYGMTNMASTHGDVYSYGILLLELFTGKRPTDDTFKEILCLRSFVEMVFPKRIIDVIDVRLLHGGGIEEHSQFAQSNNNGRFLDCVASVLGIGLRCTQDLPLQRMEMKNVINELKVIRNSLVEN